LPDKALHPTTSRQKGDQTVLDGINIQAITKFDVFGNLNKNVALEEAYYTHCNKLLMNGKPPPPDLNKRALGDAGLSKLKRAVHNTKRYKTQPAGLA